MKPNQNCIVKMKKKTNWIKLTAETEKMTGRSVILQKKLSELESELADVIRLPLDPTSTCSITFHDIKQRFVFLKNLLHQEIASGQPQNSDELHEIGRRFTALQAEFHRWNEWRHSVCSDCTQVLLRGEEGEFEFSGEMSPEKLPSDSPVDDMIGSKRDACTQVVPYDDDESEGDFSGEETPVKEEAAVVVTEKKVWGKMGKYSGAFGCGMIFGAVCMAKLFFISYSHDNFIQYEALLLPPT
ncbi:hypothetical protein CASFOL_008434 [Castilleja foliolosa]|uniref:DUF7610 domain-containing protein n=1 Tax=Castilleja foliolosa TaxID=1961234 RepID=A0ABD3DYZ1_9LAMI